MDASDTVIRAGTAHDWDAICELLTDLFHESWSQETRDAEQSVWEPERSLVAEDGDVVAGHAAAYTRELTVPGAVVPAAHISLVGVAPTHRRRGLLTRMMHRQLGEIAAAGREPIAVLWASETKIYPRFGYGHAAQRLRLNIATPEVRLPAADPVTSAKGRLRAVDPRTAHATFAAVRDQLRPGRTGWSSRDDTWWKFVLADEESQRDGATKLHGVVLETPEGPAGYALWRAKRGWTEKGPDGVVHVQELVAADPETYLTLWRYLLSIDLVRRVTYGMASLDDPLFHLVDEPRRLGGELADALWIRVIDVAAALSARRYSAPLDMVLEVTDRLLDTNQGRWRLTVTEDGRATCTRTDAPADVACDVLDLGAAYLGAVSLAALAAAGRVRELTPGALRRTAAAFLWHRLPQPAEVF
ncbi:GNAT family N-acetyltransferase [Symbioplanes lichenis]|uniref:GNAT family N-acetyltransferase n=1 Tax=Symbioplanes lichenis TaxID=1629072 RepID=UPI002738531D|nr:GNAT family N-acetyltransferase [Actinoplanes lichenis]